MNSGRPESKAGLPTTQLFLRLFPPSEYSTNFARLAGMWLTSGDAARDACWRSTDCTNIDGSSWESRSRRGRGRLPRWWGPSRCTSTGAPMEAVRWNFIFWGTTPCSLVNKYRLLGSNSLHLQSRWLCFEHRFFLYFQGRNQYFDGSWLLLFGVEVLIVSE